MYIIAIDIGTTNCKALMIDEAGNVKNSFQLPVVSQQDDAGSYEQDSELIFQSVIQLLKQLLEKENNKEVAAISFSAAMHSILAVDMEGRPVTNAMIWADTRSKKYAQLLKNSEAGKRIHRQTGTPVHAMSPLSKLIWMKKAEPEIFANAHKFISIKEYIFFRLFGKFIVDEGIASATGMYDIYNYCWYEEALQAAGIEASKLSEVVPATHIEKKLTEKVKNTYPFLENISFVCGGNDGCLANLGCAALEEKEAALSIGTSGAIRVAEYHPDKDNIDRLFRYLLTRKIYITGGPVNNGGIAIEWFAKNFLNITIDSPANFDKVMDIASAAPAGSDNVLFLPYLLGERAPVWDEDATGILYGLKLQHGKEILTRAVIEGISFNLRQILEDIERTGKGIEEVIVSGVITKSEWWMQLLADVFGKKVILNETADASAMGAAFMGMLAVGIINDFSAIKPFSITAKTFTPEMTTHAVYENQYKMFKSLYPCFQRIAGNK